MKAPLLVLALVVAAVTGPSSVSAATTRTSVSSADSKLGRIGTKVERDGPG